MLTVQIIRTVSRSNSNNYIGQLTSNKNSKEETAHESFHLGLAGSRAPKQQLTGASNRHHCSPHTEIEIEKL